MQWVGKQVQRGRQERVVAELAGWSTDELAGLLRDWRQRVRALTPRPNPERG